MEFSNCKSCGNRLAQLGESQCAECSSNNYFISQNTKKVLCKNCMNNYSEHGKKYCTECSLILEENTPFIFPQKNIKSLFKGNICSHINCSMPSTNGNKCDFHSNISFQ